MSWSTLSEDLWKHILQYVPLSHRFESCSRVNKTLYRAAAAATQHIQKLYQGEAGLQRSQDLCQWMLHHGEHVTSLVLGVYGTLQGGTLTQLPCPNLRALDLFEMQVQLSGSSTQPGVMHSCTRLTKLLLHNFQLIDGHSSLAALSALVELQHLNLTIRAVMISDDDSFLPSTVLQHLSQLTCLCLQNAGRLLNEDSLQHVSCLVNLQELELFGSNVPLSHSTAPGWSSLTALRKVRLQHANLDPSILQDCTQLQGLELYHLAIISAGGAAALHSLLGRLQQLQSLQLFGLEYDWPVAAAAYSSLTASSHLQKLHLTVDDMPAGVWPHVFAPDHQLPALRDLTLSWLIGDDEDAQQPPPPAVLGTADITCLASCCPGLRRIGIDVQPAAKVAALAKASGLTGLFVSGLHAEGFKSLSSLRGLVSLQGLTVDLSGPITPQDLLCLTALTGLTTLCINPGLSADYEGGVDVDVYFRQGRHPASHDPPVWLQLLKHCGQFSECQPAILQGLGQQLVEQQQRHTVVLRQQEQQLTAQQQQIAKLQAQLATTRAQAAVSQAVAAQAAAAATEAATAAGSAAAEAGELRGRLQALEGQVQQLLQAMLHPGR